MTWDLLHLRFVISEMHARDTADFTFLHCFASHEKGLMKLLKLNPIKRLFCLDDHVFCRHQNTIFDLENCSILETPYKKDYLPKINLYKIKQECKKIENDCIALFHVS